MMKPNFIFNEDYAFLMFISLVSALLFLLSGVSVVSAFLTGIFLYIYLRFCYFLWGIIRRFLGRGMDAGGGKKHDA